MSALITEHHHSYRATDDRLAPVMFGLAFIFLMILAALIVVWVDIPRVAELRALEAANAGTSVSGLMISADRLGAQLFALLLMMWPLFIAESLYHLSQSRALGASRNNRLSRIATAVIPPLRLGTPSLAWQGRTWLPVLNWVLPGKASSTRLSRIFGKPMIAIALLILPVLLLEFGFASRVANHAWLQMLIHVATGFIWFAFALEFILMLGVTDKKLQYIKKNWIDLAIILLPLVSFLRSIRALRLSKLAKVQQLAKMGRVYRMRGLGMKLFRALLLLEVVNRVLRVTPARQIVRLEALRQEHLDELAELDRDIAALRKRSALDVTQHEDAISGTAWHGAANPPNG